jgi:hypothetical protein
MREAGAAATLPQLQRGEADTSPSGDGDEDDQTCPTCGGEAIVDGEVCGTCNGSGSIMREADPKTKTCPVCKGKGKIAGGLPCKACDGKGVVPVDWKPAPPSDGPPWAKGKEAEAFAGMMARINALEDGLRETASLRESKPGSMAAVYSNPTRVRTSDGREGYKVVLIREGKGNAEDDNWYTSGAIKEMCESGVAEGMQAYANHPDLEEEENRPERDVKHLVGSYADVTFKEAGGKPRAEAVFVPLSTDENHPTYGWVVTLAEAASKSTAPQPLCGISLYGFSAGDFGQRPDLSEGRVVTLIRPTSGDVVTNAGAGGEFVRRLMESARRLRRATTTERTEPMEIGTFKTQMAEALKTLREADTDEKRTTAMKEVERLEGEASKIDAPAAMPSTVEAMTEAAPALVKTLREAATKKVEEEKEALATQLREAQAKLSEADTFISGITDVQGLVKAIREAGVTDEVEVRHFVHQAKVRKLSEAADVKDMVEGERAYVKAQEDKQLKALREAMNAYDLPEVEGAFGRTPEGGDTTGTGGVDLLRESGVPLKTPTAA